MDTCSGLDIGLAFYAWVSLSKTQAPTMPPTACDQLVFAGAIDQA